MFFTHLERELTSESSIFSNNAFEVPIIIHYYLLQWRVQKASIPELRLHVSHF